MSDPEMPTSSSVCEVPIHSKLNFTRLLDSVRWARDRSASTQHTPAIRAVVTLDVQSTLHQTCYFVAQQPNYGIGHRSVEVSKSHTNTHTHTRYVSTERVISSSQRQLPTPHKQTQRTNVHVLRRIRTQDPGNQAATGLRVKTARPPGSH